MLIHVTEIDIVKGHRRNTWSCPVCLALWRETGLKWVVEETNCYPLINRNAFVPLPAEAITFISTFANTGVGRPFSFTLELPEGLMV
jgi:hypothetical protein